MSEFFRKDGDQSILIVKQLELSGKLNALPEIPEYFICPLSKKLMTNPVLCVINGFSYDRTWAEDLFFRRDPEPKPEHFLVENKNLARAIAHFCKELVEKNAELVGQLTKSGQNFR